MKNRIVTLLILLNLAVLPNLFSQNVGINSTGNMPDTSAMLDVSSNNKGFLAPRMTTAEQTAIILPAKGLAVFNTTVNAFQVNTGTPLSPIWSSLITANTANAWSIGGNSVASAQNIGTTTNFDFPFITNNTEKMRLSAGGNMGIGATVVDGVNAEKLLVNAGTSSYNVISGKGDLNSYLQLNIKNINAGTSASSDVVATNDAGTEANGLNFIDMGINSSGNTSTGVLGGANTSYLYTTGSDFSIGNAVTGKSLLLFTGGVASSNERMRIDGNGNVGIGIAAPTALLHLKAGAIGANTAPLKFTSGSLMTTAEAGGVEFLTDKFYGTITTGAARKEFTLNETTLSSARVPFANASGRLTDLATFTYAGNRLSPTYITLGAGTATAGSAPLIFTTGVNLTAPVTGAMEFDGTHFYGSVSSTRYQLDQQAGTVYTGSNGITLSGTDFRNNLITGISGGQTVIGGASSANSLTLTSTSHVVKGKIIFGLSAYDELNNRLGLGNSIPTEVLDVTGNLKFSGALMPNNLAGTAGTFLTSNGAGTAPTWVTFDTTNIGSFSQKVRSLFSATAPITYSNGLIGITQANTSTAGYLSSTDWNTFNNKGSGSVTSASVVTANGVSGTVATTTTTPAITLTLGAITPSSVVATGTVTGSNLSGSNTGDQTITLTGDVTGTGTGSFAATIASNAVTYDKMQAVSTTGKLLGSSSTTTPVQEITLGTGLSMTGTTLNVGNAATVTTNANLTGPVTSVGNATTITNSAVANANLANMATMTIKGNTTGGTAAPTDLSVTQVTAMLNTFTSALKGLVPLSGGGTSNFLRADGTWAAPSSNAWNITGNAGISPVANFIGTTDSKSLRFRTNNVQRVIFDSTGNVGIGTTGFDATVPEKLLVNAGTNTVNGAQTPLTPINAIGFTNGYQQIQVQNRAWGQYSSSDFVAASDGTQNGTVPYNTDAHYVDLGINSSGYSNNNSNILNQPFTSYLYSASPEAFLIGNGYSGKDLVFFTNYGPTNSASTADGFGLMWLKGGTNAATQQVTIGTATPNGTNKLTVSGSISASAFNVSSDRRLKTNIKSLSYGLKEILALKPVIYNWKKTPATNEQLGLIAQEAKNIIPEAVSGNEATGMLSINYTELIPVLINAIKEQQQQIDTLKKDIQLLKDKN